MTQHAVSHAETPLEALLLEETLLLAHQLETSAAATRELARKAVQAARPASAGRDVRRGGRQALLKAGFSLALAVGAVTMIDALPKGGRGAAGDWATPAALLFLHAEWWHGQNPSRQG